VGLVGEPLVEQEVAERGLLEVLLFLAGLVLEQLEVWVAAPLPQQLVVRAPCRV